MEKTFNTKFEIFLTTSIFFELFKSPKTSREISHNFLHRTGCYLQWIILYIVSSFVVNPDCEFLNKRHIFIDK